MIEGVDYSHARPTRDQLSRAGARFACRYLLDPARDEGKALSRDEALRLNSWGIAIVNNFEYAIGGMLLGYNQGVKDATTALSEIRRLGIPRNEVYFSCDTDINRSQIPAVLDYMRGCSAVLGKANVGVYGEYDLMIAAYNAGYRLLWQTYGWSNGQWFAHNTCEQYHNHAFPDWDGDKDRALVADFGQWSLLGKVDDVGTIDPAQWDVIKPEMDRLSEIYTKRLPALEANVKAIQTTLGVQAVKLSDIFSEVDMTEEQLTDLANKIGQIPGSDPTTLANAISDILGTKLTTQFLDALALRLQS